MEKLISLGFYIDAQVLFDYMRRSLVMKNKGYQILCKTHQNNIFYLHFNIGNRHSYIQIIINAQHGPVSSFFCHVALDQNNTIESDINELIQEVKILHFNKIQ